MTAVMNRIVHLIEENSRRHEAKHGKKLYPHLSQRIKSDDGIRIGLMKLDPQSPQATYDR